MTTSHRWFRSGAYSLLGHIDSPQTGRARLGVLIVPPFGWEDVCSYRPLRFFGGTLAANGIPALRFDLPGTGDSSGSTLDSGLLDAWIQSVGDAAAELRVATDVEDVAVVGIGLGAILAVAAAARGANLQDLVLWGSAANGRAILRELRAFRQMELSEYANCEAVPPQSIPGLEIAGFLITPETQSALESLDLSALLHMQGRRILVFSRDAFPPDAKLIRTLEGGGCTVEIRTGHGYAAMLAAPHEAVPPTETARAVVEFLTRDRQEKWPQRAVAVTAEIGPTKRAEDDPVVTVVEEAGTSCLETIHALECLPPSIFGILSEPGVETPRTDLGLLFLNPGAVRHIGSNRMWVEAARRWAARGVPSLRMDFGGIGESGGELTLDVAGLYQGQFLEQIEMAMASLRSRAGARRFVAIGLCSGAFWAFHAAIRNPEIRGAILMNPRLFFWDPEVDRRRMLRRVVSGITDSTALRRLARGKIKPGRIKQAARIVLDNFRNGHTDGDRHLQIPPQAMAHALAAIESNQSRLTLVFTEDEPLLLEMEEEAQLPPENSSGIRCIRIPNCGHTFRPQWAQELVHKLIDCEIDSVLRENMPVLEGHSASASK